LGGAIPLAAQLLYSGGPLLANVQIEPIFLRDSYTLQLQARVIFLARAWAL
jgi:hypothetical protein